ncbi:MAG: nuclear transport factor 2 family protein [Pseudomonadota bacterium]
MATAKDNAIGLYLEGIRDGHPREAIAKYTGARYTQHSTGVADGPEGFVSFFEPFLARNPDRDIQVVRALQDGSNVFVHVHQVLNGGTARWVTTDFFESDAAGRIVEHWDVIEADQGLNPAGRSQVDGPAELTDFDQTDANKAVVQDFIDAVLIRRDLARAPEFLAADLMQHTPGQQDGRGAFDAFYGAGDCPLSYQECFMAVGEGNFVATLNRAQWKRQDVCRVDLFRVQGGLIAEHWANSELVPPKQEWANSGKF